MTEQVASGTGSGRTEMSLRGEREIVVRREFDAPRHLVYRAYTTPELVARWWTAGCVEAGPIEIDLRPGGKWRYVMIVGDGTEQAFYGEFREVVPDERIVRTEIYEPYPDHVAVDTATFVEREGRTTLTLVIELQDAAVREQVLRVREEGQDRAFDLLEQVARSLAGEAS